MFSRFIAVLADDPIRNNMIAFIQANPDADQENIDAHSQAFADAGWNINLRHPVTDRKQASQEKKVEQSTSLLANADTEAQMRVFEAMTKNNPELLEAIAKLKKEKK